MWHSILSDEVMILYLPRACDAGEGINELLAKNRPEQFPLGCRAWKGWRAEKLGVMVMMKMIIIDFTLRCVCFFHAPDGRSCNHKEACSLLVPRVTRSNTKRRRQEIKCIVVEERKRHRHLWIDRKQTAHHERYFFPLSRAGAATLTRSSLPEPRGH